MYIYTAEKDGVFIRGTVEELAVRLGKCKKHIYQHSSNKSRTREGWKIWRAARRPYVFVAEHPNDDPIVGDVEEVAALLGINESTVYEIARKHGRTREGWMIRYAEGSETA